MSSTRLAFTWGIWVSSRFLELVAKSCNSDTVCSLDLCVLPLSSPLPPPLPTCECVSLSHYFECLSCGSQGILHIFIPPPSFLLPSQCVLSHYFECLSCGSQGILHIFIPPPPLFSPSLPMCECLSLSHTTLSVCLSAHRALFIPPPSFLLPNM